MLKLIRNRAGLVLAGLVAALCPMLMAPSGGFPSNPTFQGVTVNSSLGAFGLLVNSNAPATFGSFVQFNTQGTQAGIVGIADVVNGIGAGSVAGDLVLRENGHRVLVTATGGASTVDITPADSATLTWSFQIANTVACSVNGTDGTFILHKIGKIVVVKVLTSGSCTMLSSTSLSTNNTPIPAAFRPSITSAAASPALTGSSNPLGQVSVSAAGNLTITLPAASTTIGVPLGTQFSYTTD